jgi:serine protease Do
MTMRALAAIVFLAALSAPAPAQISSNPKILAPFKAVVASANESTVRIRCDDKDAALGTVVYADGFILTKASEVLAHGSDLRGTVSVRFHDGSEFDATLVGTDKKTDLAMLRVDVKGLKPVVFAESKKVPAGNWLASAGPTSDALAVGVVSVRTRTPSGADASDTNHNRGYLGIFPVDEKDKDGNVIGAKINEVSPKGAADKAGIKKNDVVIAINGKTVKGQAALREYLEGFRPGDIVRLKLMRGDEEKELKATLTGQIEKSRGDIQNAMGGELSGRRGGFPSILQTDMVVRPQDCGGPVVDLDGNVLGINIARAGRVETWVLPSETIRPLLEDLKSGKFAPARATKSGS